MSEPRLCRYLTACGGNTSKAMTLYRKNLQLSQALFIIISCFEITFRNAIDRRSCTVHGNDWLRDAVRPGGRFDNDHCRIAKSTIEDSLAKIRYRYAHSRLVAELGFGFWRYLFAPHQYLVTGRILLNIFSARPTSTPAMQYNHTYIFNRLAEINHIRNRIAHHEPVCFRQGQPVKDTQYARRHYAVILQLFQWMSVDAAALLYGMDHIQSCCDSIDRL